MERLKIVRKDDILRSIDGLKPLQSLMNEKMLKKIAEVNSVFNSDETLRERRRTLEQRWQEHSDGFVFSVGELERQLTQLAKDQILSSQKPVVLVLKVDQATILEAYQLEAS